MNTENEFKKAKAIGDVIEDDGSNIAGWGLRIDAAEVEMWLRFKDRKPHLITLYANGTYKIELSE